MQGFHRVTAAVVGAVVLFGGLIGAVIAQGSSGGFPNGPATEDQVLRGRYIVTAVASCADCHGGHGPGAPGWLAGYDPKDNPQGMFQVGPATVYALNITPDPDTGIGNWTPQQIFTALRDGIDDEGKMLCPPMPWPVFHNMSDEDRWAVVAYLKHVKPVSHEVPQPAMPDGGPVDCASFYPPQMPPLPAFPAASEVGVQ